MCDKTIYFAMKSFPANAVGKVFTYDGNAIGEIISVKHCKHRTFADVNCGVGIIVKISDESVLNCLKGKMFKPQLVHIESKGGV